MAIVFTNVNVNVTNKGKYIWFLETIIILRNLFKQPVVKQRNIIQLYNLKRKKIDVNYACGELILTINIYQLFPSSS